MVAVWSIFCTKCLLGNAAIPIIECLCALFVLRLLMKQYAAIWVLNGSLLISIFMKRTRVVVCALVALLYGIQTASAQKPAAATDFTVSDCSGTEHHLFGELDNSHVVIMEFVMGL
jgi:hypothetical protein